MRYSQNYRDVIVGGSIEEMDLRKTTKQVKEELDALKGKSLDEDDILLLITEKLQVSFYPFLSSFLIIQRTNSSIYPIRTHHSWLSNLAIMG